MLLASKSCYAVQSFILNNNSVEKNTNIKKAFFFCFSKKKKKPKKLKKLKKVINVIIQQWPLFSNGTTKNEAINEAMD